MSITVLHTADWQIGKQFKNVPGDPGAALRLQRLDTVETIARLARERQVDAVLVAGDVFEDNAVSDETLRRTVNALAAYDGPWVLLPGNHDAGLAQSAWSRLRGLSVLPDNVRIADAPEPLALCGDRLVVLPAPLRRRHEVRDLTEWFDACPTDAGSLRIGLAHGSVTNRLPEAAEAVNPIADTRAESARLDYLALGDWHGTLNVAQRTWYAGTPEPDRFKANDPGNVLLVRLPGAGAPPEVERIAVGRYRWAQAEFRLMDADDVPVLGARLEALGDGPQTLLRLTLSGGVDLATKQRLDELLDAWRARLHFIDVDDRALDALPSADDIAALGATGFVRNAIDALQAMERDAADPDRSHAARALQILFLEQGRLPR